MYVQAGELNSDTRGGDFWNMELFNNMQCQFESQYDGIQYTIARYFN